MRPISLSLTFFSLFIFRLSFAQQGDSTLAHAYFQKAEQFYKAPYFDSARVYYEKAGDLYKRENMWKEYILSSNKLIRLLFFKDDLEKIEILLNRNLAISKALQPVSSSTLTQCYFLLGRLWEHKIDYKRALQYYEKALSLEEASLPKDYQTIGEIYLSMGRVWGYKKDYEKAMQYYQKAVNIARKQEDYPLLSYCQNNIGVIYSELKDYQKALVYYQKSLALRSATFSNKNNLILTQSFYNLGETFFLLKQYPEALAYIRKSINMILSLEGENHTNLVYRYQSLGDIYFELKDHKKSIHYYQKALNIPQKSALEYAKIYLKMAKVFNATNNYPQTLFYCQQSINAAAKNSTAPPENYLNPSLNKVFDAYQLFFGLHFKAKILEQNYAIDSTNFQHINLAFQTYYLATKLIDTLRLGHSTETAIQSLSTITTATYEGAIRTAFHIHEITQQKSYLELAFQCTEKSKAFLFLRHLQNIQAQRFSTIPDSLLQLEKELKMEIAKLEALHLEKPSRVAENLFKKNRVLEALIAQLETEHPQYFHSKYDLATINIRQIQQALADKRSAVIEYFYGEEYIYVFTITKRDYWVTKIQLDNSLKEFIKSFYQQLAATDINFQAYVAAASQLYKKLLLPVLSKEQNQSPPELFTKLLVIPDGQLYYLPFEAFLTEEFQEKKPANYLQLPYLLYSRQLSYANSATLLFGKAWHNEKETTKKCLAFAYGVQDEVPLHADPYAFRSGDFSNLPGTQQEIRSLSQLFDVDAYEGANALEQYFKQKAPNYSILHLGLHGQMDSTNVLLSKLHFRNPKTDTLEDGYLHVYEIYNQQWNADLAVLSSCEAGTGKLVSGEGVLSISRAFQYAGCPSVVTTLWAIHDGPTATIVEGFYKGLSKGWSKDKALQMAKLDYIKTIDDPAKSAPSYWAGLILIGDSLPIESSSNIRCLLICFFLLFIGLLGGYYNQSKSLKTFFASLFL